MKKLYRIGLIVAFLLAAGMYVGDRLYAAPARPDLQTFDQPSGESFEARLQGDEHLNWALTEQDEVIARDSEGYWNYAAINADGIVPGGSVYGLDKKPKSAVYKEDVEQWIEENPEQLESDSLMLSAGNSYASPLSPALVIDQNTKGTQQILVLLVEFSNMSIQYSDSEWSQTFFGTTNKSVNHYYKEVSGNQLNFVPANETKGTANDGIVKVTLNHVHESGSTVVAEALAAADPYIDMASYDTDGDGYIQDDELRIVTILAGYEASYDSQTPSVWGHKTSLSAENAPVLDGVMLCEGWHGGSYTQQGERQGNHQATIGILAHELGHTLGLPDLYDTDGSSSGVGMHSLMGLGSWGSMVNEYSGATPVHLDAWSKIMLGYVTPTIARSETSQSYTLHSISTGAYNVVQVPISEPDQYFLLENRQAEGYDRGLNYAGGIAIWHIDQSRTGNYDDYRRLVDLEEVSVYAPYFTSFNGASFTPTSNPNSNRYYGSDQKPTGVNVAVTSSSSSSMNVNVYGDYSVSPPTDLRFIYEMKSIVQLAWTAPADNDIEGYVIYRNGYWYTTTTNTSFKDDFINTNIEYNYSVRTLDKAGNESVQSNLVTRSMTSSNSVILYYKQGFTNPYIQYRTYYDDPWSLVPMQNSEFPGYSKITIPKGDSISGIMVKFGDGNDNWDDNSGRLYYIPVGVSTFDGGTVVNDFPVLPPIPESESPTAPTNVAVSTKSDTSVSLLWTASTDNVGVSGYEVYQNGVKIGTTASTSYLATGLTANTTYSFTVTAYDTSGNVSSASVPLLVTTNPTGNTVTIYYKKGFSTPYIHYRQADNSWTSIPGVAMQAAEITGYAKITINIGALTQLEACFNDGNDHWDSQYGANYFFSSGVWTFDNGSITSGAPDSQPPSAPANLALTTATDTTIGLSWTASTDNVEVTGYHIYQNGVKIGSTSSTSYTATGLSAGTSYSYTVQAYDAKGNTSAVSAALYVTTNPTVGNTVTIYYKRGFATPYIHYRQADNNWTTIPGVAMPTSEVAGYSTITINIGALTQLEACFNDGNDNWDSRYGQNYFFSPGVWKLDNGVITQGMP